MFHLYCNMKENDRMNFMGMNKWLYMSDLLVENG